MPPELKSCQLRVISSSNQIRVEPVLTVWCCQRDDDPHGTVQRVKTTAQVFCSRAREFLQHFPDAMVCLPTLVSQAGKR